MFVIFILYNQLKETCLLYVSLFHKRVIWRTNTDKDVVMTEWIIHIFFSTADVLVVTTFYILSKRCYKLSIARCYLDLWWYSYIEKENNSYWWSTPIRRQANKICITICLASSGKYYMIMMMRMTISVDNGDDEDDDECW